MHIGSSVVQSAGQQCWLPRGGRQLGQLQHVWVCRGGHQWWLQGGWHWAPRWKGWGARCGWRRACGREGRRWGCGGGAGEEGQKSMSWITASSNQGYLGGGVSLSTGGGWFSEHCWAPVPWSPELSAPLRTVCGGLWLLAPPGLVRLSVCPSAEPWLLRHPGPGPGHLARAQPVPPAALEEQLPAEVPHLHWLLLETGTESVWFSQIHGAAGWVWFPECRDRRSD